MARHTIFSSEGVTAGHPDKICDQISDGIVDEFLYHDADADVSAECAVATGLVFLAVNSVSATSVDITGVAREVIADIGYADAYGFDPQTCSVITSVSHRAQGRSDSTRRPAAGSREVLVASNQASVFGFACVDTPERMPLPISLARRLAQQLDDVRRQKTLPYLAPDGKTLVAVEYEGRRPVRIHTVIVSVQHTAALGGFGESGRRRLEGDLHEAVITPVLAAAPVELDAQTRVLINPGGAFLVGGPQRDAGLTGRKNMVDTYGGYARHGGGALSGKDPSHIDRLGAYVARYVARNLVAAGLAQHCEVQLSYALGEAEPLAVSVETFGSGAAPDEALEGAVREAIDLRLASVMTGLELRHLPAQQGGVFYRRLAAYGHFGRPDLDLPWEREDQAKALAGAARARGGPRRGRGGDS